MAPLSKSPLHQLRLDGMRLRVEFLQAEIDCSFTMIAMAKTHHLMGYQEAADREMAHAFKGCRVAKRIHSNLMGVDAAVLESLSERLNNLDAELASNKPPERSSDEAALPKPVLSKQARLTAREMEVLTHIVYGNSTKQVAHLLGITFKTAASHRSSIMSKLGASNAAALVCLAIMEGLVHPKV